MKPSLDHILAFSDFLRKFREVERALWKKGSKVFENDAEHSYTLAMLAWYIAQTHKLELDMHKVLLYALTHDLVEIYAGDTPVHNASAELVQSKHEREEAARKRIESEFPEIPELHQTILNYEMKADAESRFIYALDKVEPTIAIYLDGGRIWRERGVDFRMVKEKKMSRVLGDPLVEALLDELMDRLEKEQQRLFTDKMK